MRALWILLAKDIRREGRTGEMAVSLVVFGLILVVALAFALPPGDDSAAGALWAAVLLSLVVGLGRSVEGERADGRLRYLRAAPVEPAVLYAAKAAAVGLFALLSEAALALPYAVLFGVPAAGLVRAAPVVLLGTAGLALGGTLVALVAAHARAREVLLPVLFLPLALPVVMAGVSATASAYAGEALGPWPGFLAGFALLAGGAGAFLIPYVLED